MLGQSERARAGASVVTTVLCSLGSLVCGNTFRPSTVPFPQSYVRVFSQARPLTPEGSSSFKGELRGLRAVLVS